MQAFKVIKIVSINSIILLALLGTFFVAMAQENTEPTNIESDMRTASEETSSDNTTEPETLRERFEATQQNREEQVEIRQENRTQNSENQQLLRTERAGALTEVRQNRVLNLSANISNRMEAAIARLFIISERLSSRIEKLTTAGVDTSAATTKLTEATDLLNQAGANLANIDTLVYNTATSPEPRLGWENVRTVYTETARLIRSAHLALRETIALLKTAISNAGLNQSNAVRNENSITEVTGQ